MRRKMMLALAALLTSTLLQAQTIFYVNISTGNDASSGTNWSNSYRNLTKALAAANTSTASEVQIWVAEGTYTPEDGISSLPTDHRDTSFTFYRGAGIGRALKVYGGFTGSETSIGARDTSHHTYLDGIISSGNSFHIGVIAGLSASADSVVLDRLTFSNGIAQGTSSKVYNGFYVPQNFGGGLALVADSSSKICIRNCIFLANTCKGYATGYPTYTGAVTMGGGLYAGAACLLDGCSFWGNRSEGGTSTYGGSAYGGGVAVALTGIVASNCSFYGNFTGGGTGSTSSSGTGGSAYGGAICMYQHNGTIISNCTFSGNSVAVGEASRNGNSYGGAMCNVGSNAIITNCNFRNNLASDYNNLYGSTTFYGYGENYGGAVGDLNSAATYTNCVFDSNSALNISYYGNIGGGAVYNRMSNDTFNNCTIVNNKSDNGCGLYFDSSGGYFRNSTISKNQFYGGTANRQGGAVYTIHHSYPVFYHSSIDSNDMGGFVHNISYMKLLQCNIRSNHGSGLYLYNATQDVDSCLIANNAGMYGGGAFVNTCSFSPRNCVFSGNTATDEGGAVFAGYAYSYTSSYNAAFTSMGNVYIGNKAKWGGAVKINICATCIDTLFNNLFIANTATDTTGGGGGAINVTGSRNYIFNNTFVNDSARWQGGAIRLEGTGGLTRVANNIFFGCGNVASSSTSDTSIGGTGSFSFFNNTYRGSNPLFLDSLNYTGADNIWHTADDGLQLQMCSPAVNAGNNAYTYTGETDFLGQNRVASGTVDIGAYESNIMGAVTGADSICISTTHTYTDTTAGGSWSTSDATVVTINTSTGAAIGVAAGVATITYSRSYSCGVRYATKMVTIERPVSVITATPDSICVGGTIVVTDSLSGGSWLSMDTTRATVDASGNITTLSAGIDTIRYTLTNACGTTTARKAIVIERTVSPIYGPTVICASTPTSLFDSVAGGSWTTTNPTVASITSSGSVRGVRAGVDTINYTLINTCGTSSASYVIYLETLPSSIFGIADTLCATVGAVSASDSVIGGVWHVSNTSVMVVIDSLAGTFSTVTTGAGLDTITYTTTNACGVHTVSKVVTIIGAGAGTIYGAISLCPGDTTTLHDTTFTGGIWSSATTSVATINTTGKVTAITGGSSIISYTITNICGTSSATHTVTVTAPPTAATITGPDTVCQGNAITLSASATGGTWATVTGNASAAGATITGVNPGIDTVKYTLSNTCGTAIARKVITVYSTAHCDSATGAAVSSQPIHSIQVWPNPAQQQITVQLNTTPGTTTLVMTNVLGVKVAEWNIANNKPATLPIALPSGVYLLTAGNGPEKLTTRIVIE